MFALITAFVIFASGEPPSNTFIVEEETFDLTSWLDPDGWDCVSRNGANRLRIEYQRKDGAALVIHRWHNRKPIEAFRSSCGPDLIAGSSTSINLTSDLCDNWHLSLRLLETSTTRAILDLDWKGHKLRGYQCRKTLESRTYLESAIDPLRTLVVWLMLHE